MTAPRITSRQVWGAEADLGPMMRLPASALYVHHSVTLTDPRHDVDLDDAIDAMREIERIGVARFGRYSYSWAFHPHDPVHRLLEGAGLTVGAHTANRNSSSFGFVAIGNYEELDPPDRLIDDMGWMAAHLVTEGLLVRNFHLAPHQEVKATACPGRRLIARLPDLRDAIAGWLAGAAPAPIPKEPRVKVTADLPLLREGSRGQHVAALQELLNIKGDARLVVDGRFGPDTRVAVENWQRVFRLATDGIVGAITWGVLLAMPL